jgi:hypothetical protein
LRGQFAGALELNCGGFSFEDLPRLQKANKAITEANWHGCVVKAGLADNRAWLVDRPFGQLFLHLQTCGAGAAFSG